MMVVAKTAFGYMSRASIAKQTITQETLLGDHLHHTFNLFLNDMNIFMDKPKGFLVIIIVFS